MCMFSHRSVCEFDVRHWCSWYMTNVRDNKNDDKTITLPFGSKQLPFYTIQLLFGTHIQMETILVMDEG